MLSQDKRSRKESFKEFFFSFFCFNKVDKEEEHVKISYVSNSKQVISKTSSDLKLVTKEEKVIILIGSTGKGKSTLANVLVNRNNNFEEIFEESAGSISKTREAKSERFIKNNLIYRVIDTVGLGDTKLPRNEVLDKIAEAVYLAKDGINQVFFVINGRFDVKEIDNYEILKSVIFDEGVINHTTIIRTRFENFRDEDKCKEDFEELRKNDSLREIIDSCQGFVHVNNPSLNLIGSEDEGKDKKQRRLSRIAQRKEDRVFSRRRLIENLNSSEESFYQPSKLKNLGSEIAEIIEKKKDLERVLQQEFGSSPSSPTLDEFKKVNTSFSLGKEQPLAIFDGIIETIATTKENNKENIYYNLHDDIKKLEKDKEKLESEIRIKQAIIRRKVLRHILNNSEAIMENLNSDDFLLEITDDGKDWTEIYPNFSLLAKTKWLRRDFDHEETKEWQQALGKSFEEGDAGFCAWLRDNRGLNPSTVATHDIPLLKKKYRSSLGSRNREMSKANQRVNVWTTAIHLDFAQMHQNRTYQYWWEESGLTFQDAEEWLGNRSWVGKVENYKFIDWLKYCKEVSASEFGSFGDFKKSDLKDEYENYSVLCDNCGASVDYKSVYFGSRKRHLDLCSEICYDDWKAERERWISVHSEFFRQNDKRKVECNWIHLWKKIGIDYTDARQWIEAGFEPEDYSLVGSWKKQGWTTQQTKKYLLQGFLPQDFMFLTWLRVKRTVVEQLAWEEIYSLRINYQQLWGNIDAVFSEIVWNDKTYQQLWEENNIDYYQAREWVKLGRVDESDDNDTYYFCWPSEWINEGFSLVTAKPWLELGLKASEFEFASLLRSKGYNPDSIGIDEVIKQESWQDLRPDFSYALRKDWEKIDCTYQDVRKLIEAGFEVSDYQKFRKWKENSFTSEQALFWLKNGLNKDNHELATYLRDNNFTPKQYANFTSKKAQEWLDYFYPIKERNTISKMDIFDQGLIGSLDLSDFVKLEVLICSNNKLTSLILPAVNCIRKIWANDNLLTSFDYDILNVDTLDSLGLISNNLGENNLVVFSHLFNLTYLLIGNYNEEKIKQGFYNHLKGSLSLLKDLNKLEYLDISNTDISEGLEYLPESLNHFYCANDKRPESQCQILLNLLADSQGTADENLIQELRDYKQELREQSIEEVNSQ